MPFFWNPTYWLFIAPALLFMLYAQWRVKSAYSKWDKVANARHMTGAEIAQRLMAENGLQGINVRGIPGHLTDNYDPRTKTLNLSESSAREGSVASMAVVAHEMGHAMQDASNMGLLRLRGGLVPAVNFGSQLGPILFIVGYFLQFSPIMWLGIAFFSMAFVFALVTLPVEINASSRALHMLNSGGMIVGEDEKRGARAVLTAAALTYVAALLMSLMQLIYYVVLARGGRRRR
jgi:Zn-dependent membrane protease YugP